MTLWCSKRVRFWGRPGRNLCERVGRCCEDGSLACTTTTTATSDGDSTKLWTTRRSQSSLEVKEIWNVLRPAGTPSSHSKPRKALTHWIRPDKIQFGRDKQKEPNRSKYYSKTCYIPLLVYRREGFAAVAATIFTQLTLRHQIGRDLFQAPWCAGYWQRPKLGIS